MKFWEIIRYEIAYQVRRPWLWVFVGVMLALNFLMARDGAFAEVLYSEFYINSPFAILKTTVFGGLVWMLMAAAIAGEAAARDVATGMHPLIYTVPVSKAQYLGGRFIAALILNLALLLVVQVAILLAIYLPGVHPDLIGPFRPEAFLTAYGFLSLPNAIFVTALQFGFALSTGRPVTAYFGSLIIFFTAFFIASFILFQGGPGSLIDPLGVHFIWSDLSRLWTNVEKNTRVLQLSEVLENRLIWLGIGATVGLLAYIGFAFRHRVNISLRERIRRLFGQRRPVETTHHAFAIPTPAIALPKAQAYYGLKLHVRQTLIIAWNSFRAIATSWSGLALLIFIPLMSIPVVLDQMYSIGAPLTPLTSRVLSELTGPISAELSRWVIVPGFIIFFAGELVWRERDFGVSELTDSMPGSEWPPFLGKFLGICLVLALFNLLIVIAGMAAQMLMNYSHFQLDLYAKVMFGLQLPEYILFAVVALLIHVVVDQKYTGHVVAILVYMYIALLATMLGVEHNMLIYGAAPGWSFTEMRGFGDTIGPWLSFKLYWAGWALLLAVVGRLFWVRGKEYGLPNRLKLVRLRWNKINMSITGAAVVLLVVTGGYVFYNTNILNDYTSHAEAVGRSAEYERRYRQYADLTQPELQATDLRIEFFPDDPAVDIIGTHRLVNRTSQPIDSILVATASTPSIHTKSLTLDGGFQVVIDDENFGHRMFKLDAPMQPGDTLELHFDLHVEQRGFGNHGRNPILAKDGSVFSNDLLPAIGYQHQRELIQPADRREHGLPPRPIIASLYAADDARLVSRGEAISLHTVLVTNENQVAVAPGKLLRTYSEQGRRVFEYATSAPVAAEWHFFSANYELLEETWIDSATQQQVVIQIFHHPDHTGHLQRTLRSVKASLEFYNKEFRTYPYDHVTVVEHPAAPGAGLHASPAMIYYGQAIPFWDPEDENTFDFPYAVVGHEMGHLFGVPYAVVEGAPFLAEGLAWYFSMQMVKATRGEIQLRRLLSFMRLPYPHPVIRRGEPLLRALDPYMSYRKGPLAMHTLTAYAGSETVNGAIRRMIEQHRKPNTAGATALDLYHELQVVVPDSVQGLLHDLFEVNVYWQFETSQVKAKKSGDNEWQVTLDVTARKMMYDSAGVATELPMDEWIPIGVFTGSLYSNSRLDSPAYLQKHRIRSGNQSITVTTTSKPVLAGIDPYHVLDWEENEEDENVKQVTIESSVKEK